MTAALVYDGPMDADLTDAQLAELRTALIALREELKVQLDSTSEASKPVDLEEPIGRLSRMDAMQQQKMAEASRRSARRRYDQVGAALERMDRNEYGQCIRCEEDIGFRRLSVRPESTLCLGCQSARERG